jgi:hypothetical protein
MRPTKPRWLDRLAIIALLAAFAACAGQDDVLFVTNTNVGVNLDSKPPSIGIAYDREEGYIGPAYDNGALPPVIARLSSNLSVFAPEVHQTYATGAAATLLADPDPTLPQLERPLLHNSKRAAYFVTESSTGLRMTFASQLPDSVHLGYRRKEFSLIPIGTDRSGTCGQTGAPGGAATPAEPVDCYGSALATIDLGTNVGDPQHTNMQVAQLFATGRAAEVLAARDEGARSLFQHKLGIVETMRGNGDCDGNCARLEAFLSRSGESGREAVRTKCMAPVRVASFTNFLRSTDYQGARQGCVIAIGA